MITTRLSLWPRVLALVLLALFLAAAVPIGRIWLALEYSDTGGDRDVMNSRALLPKIGETDRHVLLLMIDGLAVQPFERAMAEGRLPTLSRLMTERPSARLVAVSTFPSATSPSVPELLSGRYVEMPGLDAPTAVHAFDRVHRSVVRYVTRPDSWQWPVPTLFDVVSDRRAITVFEGRWDGPVAILTQFNLLGQAFLETIGAAGFGGGDRGPVEAYLRELRSGEPPALSLIVFNAFDMAAHFHGPGSPEAQRALEGIDTLIGEILQALAQSPGAGGGGTPLPNTTVVLFGDHGITASSVFIDLAGFFTRRGQATVDVSTIGHVLLRERLGSLWTEWTDIILVAGGSNITQVYLKDENDGWRAVEQGASEDSAAARKRRSMLRSLATDIARLEGVAQVIRVDGPDRVEVQGRGSEALILTRSDAGRRRYAYVLDADAEADPFGYLAHPSTLPLVCRGAVTKRCFHDPTAWIDASAGSRYPGAVALVPKAFRPAQFAGDLMVAAEPGYTFLRGQRGDHGHLGRESILTPLWLNGPGIRPCTERHQPKLVDLFPSVAVLLGAAADDPALAGLDGRVLDCILPVGE